MDQAKININIKDIDKEPLYIDCLFEEDYLIKRNM